MRTGKRSCQNPIGQLPRRQLLVARREQHAAALGQLAALERGAAPVVVGAVAQHELDLLLRPQQCQLLVAIAMLLRPIRAS